ncbi:MAG: corrinoid protein [Thermodesulfobacteriota bacterium]
MVDQQAFYQALSEGKTDAVKELTRAALAGGAPAEVVLKEGLLPAMDRIGLRFKNCEIYIPEVLIAARAMHGGLGVLKPVLAKSTNEKTTKVVLGTVKGDMHDIGKNLVGMMLEGGGFEVIDLGVDVSEADFIRSAKESGAKVIAMSALLTTTMVEMKVTIDAARAAGLDDVKMIVGGAPVTEEFARRIGADGYAADAGTVVGKVRELVAA